MEVAIATRPAFRGRGLAADDLVERGRARLMGIALAVSLMGQSPAHTTGPSHRLIVEP